MMKTVEQPGERAPTAQSHGLHPLEHVQPAQLSQLHTGLVV
jgi:hypothetical protein